MKRVESVAYQCEVCGTYHNTMGGALECEQLGVLRDKGAKVGDIVRITAGDGVGQRAKVRELSVVRPGWGPSRYTHTRALSADVIDSWGSRFLTFDNYECI